MLLSSGHSEQKRTIYLMSGFMLLLLIGGVLPESSILTIRYTFSMAK